MAKYTKKNYAAPQTSRPAAGTDPRFMECMAPNQLQGTGIRGVQQGAIRAANRSEAQRRARNTGGPFDYGPGAFDMGDYRRAALGRKIGNKGGSTSTRQDMLDRG